MKSATLRLTTGVDLAYTDTGAPENYPYITIFAVHGIIFSNLVFKRVQSVALSKGFRFVAISRRGFPGSTPYKPEEINTIINAEEPAENRYAFMEARGHEIASFIDIFASKFGLPISKDKISGSILLGWSQGAQYVSAAIAFAPTLPSDVRIRLRAHIRSVVFYEPPPVTFGLPNAEKNWMPIFDVTIPEAPRIQMVAQWITAYFNHGDLTKRDPNALEYVVPATDKSPSIFNNAQADMEGLECYTQDACLDVPLFAFADQFKAIYRKAIGCAEVMQLFPDLKIAFVVGERSPSFAWVGLWAVQDDQKEIGSTKIIHYKVIPGANHLIHWDNPDKALEVFTSKL
ncbi:alpha/beta-hydrolase [Pholiota conissans]|uniref:Alpha/beta-hydrolase n=1 Tax=Pholiota conissans TaxID=109636 RepID=A0A9P5ZC29_9AGAR|nr:alpha/beta-hydrolase [Pholiota conissans]